MEGLEAWLERWDSGKCRVRYLVHVEMYGKFGFSFTRMRGDSCAENQIEVGLSDLHVRMFLHFFSCSCKGGWKWGGGLLACEDTRTEPGTG